MPWQKPPSDEILQKAAEMRAGGASWPEIGRKVGRKAETCRRWPKYYAPKWAEFLATESLEILTDAAAESMLVLRRQLRSKSEVSSRDAAGKIIRYFTTMRAKDQLLPDPLKEDKPARPSALALAEYLEGLNDEEYAAVNPRFAAAELSARLAGEEAARALAAGPVVPDCDGGDGLGDDPPLAA